MRNDSDDECEAWLLGNGERVFAADVSLGVILNRLALLCLHTSFGKVHKFYKLIILENKLLNLRK
jgi:hypothetical protein